MTVLCNSYSKKQLLSVRKDSSHGPHRVDVRDHREAGSLSAASRLRIPIPTVSRRLSELEARLKTQLFQRSPRHLTLTDAGQSYIEACKRIIEQVNDAEQEASGEYRTPTGDLAVTSPWGLRASPLAPALL
jgi:DNA-binding transcriptional LysR family regulator